MTYKRFFTFSIYLSFLYSLCFLCDYLKYIYHKKYLIHIQNLETDITKLNKCNGVLQLQIEKLEYIKNSNSGKINDNYFNKIDNSVQTDIFLEYKQQEISNVLSRNPSPESDYEIEDKSSIIYEENTKIVTKSPNNWTTFIKNIIS